MPTYTEFYHQMASQKYAKTSGHTCAKSPCPMWEAARQWARTHGMRFRFFHVDGELHAVRLEDE